MNEKIVPEDITLFKIDYVDIHISDDAIDKNVLKMKIAHTVMHNLGKNRIKIGLIINILKEIDEKEVTEVAKFNFDFHFEIKNMNNFYTLENETKPVFQGLLVATLLGLSFSTTRGIIYEKALNTNLNGIILPIISPNKIISECK